MLNALNQAERYRDLAEGCRRRRGVQLLKLNAKSLFPDGGALHHAS
jgi:hypothetical protein